MKYCKRGTAVALLCLAVMPGIGFTQDKFFDSNGVRIRYVEKGGGEPVILLHGDGATLQVVDDSAVFPNLAKQFRVIAFDARGSGHQTVAVVSIFRKDFRA